jgi:hypothetical protein
MADVLTSGSYVFQNQFFLEHFDAMFLVVATQWLSSFRSYGFMERAENIIGRDRIAPLEFLKNTKRPRLLSGRFLLQDLCRTTLQLLFQSFSLPQCFI